MADTQRLLQDSPDDYAVNLLHATILADSGKLDEAEAANFRLKELGEKSGDPATAPRACLVPALFAKEQRKDLKKAETLYEECLKKYPGNAFVTNEAMGFYDAIEKPERATELIREAAKQAPENLSLQASLATRLENTATGGRREGPSGAVDASVACAWACREYYRRAGYSLRRSTRREGYRVVRRAHRRRASFIPYVLIDLDQLDARRTVQGPQSPPTDAAPRRIHLGTRRRQAALDSFEQGIALAQHPPPLLGGIPIQRSLLRSRHLRLREAIRISNIGTDAAALRRASTSSAARVGRIKPPLGPAAPGGKPPHPDRGRRSYISEAVGRRRTPPPGRLSRSRDQAMGFVSWPAWSAPRPAGQPSHHPQELGSTYRSGQRGRAARAGREFVRCEHGASSLNRGGCLMANPRSRPCTICAATLSGFWDASRRRPSSTALELDSRTRAATPARSR